MRTIDITEAMNTANTYTHHLTQQGFAAAVQYAQIRKDAKVLDLTVALLPTDHPAAGAIGDPVTLTEHSHCILRTRFYLDERNRQRGTVGVSAMSVVEYNSANQAVSVVNLMDIIFPGVGDTAMTLPELAATAAQKIDAFKMIPATP